MKLHENKAEFEDLVQLTSEYKGIPETAIKKDYLICMILERVSRSAYIDQCVFKGGTSLSKCYPGSIDRFSEDVDLTYLPDECASKKAINRELRKLEELLIGPLQFEPIDSERNDKNKSSYVWSDAVGTKELGIKLEIGAVVRPVPYEMKSLKTYIQEYLESRNMGDFAREYELQGFTVNVLDIRRTFIDKLLAVKRHVICGTINKKVRHIYDVKKLMEQDEVKKFLENLTELKQIISLTKGTDIEYLEKRTTTNDYDPKGKFDFYSWKEAFSSNEVKERYESLQDDLLYTNEKQNFSEAIAAFEKINEIFLKIDE
ncbi:MAG: hypothetical protein H6Q65_199 [Firmicutes bacterium]|nr:hypothetical protein [Bacillota bacterium]